MIGWAVLLGAALEAGLSLLAEAGFGDEVRDLKERLTKRTEKARRAAFDRAFDGAVQAAGEGSLGPLLDHQPFREAVIAGLLDPETGFDLKALADEWGQQLPAHARSLRRFFSTLENALLADGTWGALLDRYHELRFRGDVLAALQERHLDVPPRHMVSALNAQLTGNGAIAQGPGAAAAGAGGVAVGGDVLGDVIQTVVERLVVERVELTAPQPGPRPEAQRTAYLGRLFETTGHLSLAGVDPKAATEAEARLDLGAVYTALLTLETEDHERLARGDLPDRELRRLSALAQLNRHPRLVLLGGPGSGKSTFVNFVAMCLAGEALGHDQADLALLTAPLPDEEGNDGEEPQPWERGPLLPVRVVLRDFAARGLPPPGKRASAEHLWRFIVADLEASALGGFGPHLSGELLERGGLLLLDGLDEVPEADRRREQIKQAVEDFTATFGRCRVLVTSRTYAYQQQDWQLGGFAEAVLAPFSPGQIRRFVDRWYAHIALLRGMHTDDAQGRAETLKRAIFGSDRLGGLAERPLLLTLMASLHAWRGGSLPEKREELYADTVDLLLDWWESPKIVRDAGGQMMVRHPSLAEWLKIDREKVRELLNELAYRAHVTQPDLVGTADVPEGDLVAGLLTLSQNPDVRPARLVEYLSHRAGLLLPRGVGVYTFPHRTFQEYLAACYLTDHDYPDLVADLARKEPNRWREVALLAGAKAARGSAFAVWALADTLCYREPEAAGSEAVDLWGAHLAGQALAETADLGRVGARDEAKVARVGRWLVHILKQEDFPALERVAAGDTLARLGDPRPGVGLRPDGLPDIAWCQVPAGPFVMGSPDDSLAFGGKETPQRQGELPPFRIGLFPVTNAQYAAFVGDGGYTESWRKRWTKAGWNWKGNSNGPHTYGGAFDLPNHPVVGVSWYEAAAFCGWLTERLRSAGELGPDEMVTLPSEPQWEKAARGTDGRVYPWGDQPDPERANYEDTGVGATSAVGCFPGGASPYEALDTSGNVWEWCRTKWQDGYQDYGGDDLAGPANDLEGDARRVLRGGAFGRYQRYVRCACRDWSGPGYRFGGSGFRLCVAPGFL
jgi:formylglycine-generating enzyme required for sulfatase activity